MSLALGIAIYIVIWATVLFAVLPWGVHTQHDANSIVRGSAESAPVNPRMGFKVLVTTLVASVVFVAFYLALTMGWLHGLVMPER